MKVLIVGAGPTGLSAALEFARQGILPDIVEKRSEPSAMSRAIGIMPETLEKLSASGVGEKIKNEAMSITKMHVYRAKKRLMALDFDTLPKQPVQHMWSLPQNRTEALMIEGLENYGVKVQFACSVTDISSDDKQATVHFDNKATQTYDWVIAADGVHSTVRQKLDIKYPGFELEGEWSIADVDVEGYDPSQVSLWIQQEDAKQQGAFYMILPIEQKRVRIVSSTPNVLETLPAPITITQVRLTGAFHIAIRQAETYQKGRVLLAGDAAHCHSPVGGRGMNLGINDAVAAVKAITSNTTQNYSRERHVKGKKILNDSEQARKTIMSKNPLVISMTTLAMKAVQRSTLLTYLASKRISTL